MKPFDPDKGFYLTLAILVVAVGVGFAWAWLAGEL